MGKHSKMTGSMDEHYRLLDVQVPIHANTYDMADYKPKLMHSQMRDVLAFVHGKTLQDDRVNGRALPGTGVCQVTSMHSLDDHSSILKEKLPVGKITGLKFLIKVYHISSIPRNQGPVVEQGLKGIPTRSGEGWVLLILIFHRFIQEFTPLWMVTVWTEVMLGLPTGYLNAGLSKLLKSPSDAQLSSRGIRLLSECTTMRRLLRYAEVGISKRWRLLESA
ncbi:hypothetical protein C5167_014991 [Papaver somniferum]|uniref:Uncharacterized protein n=1 Tax=Papaver somniferum TaxID=3469 RepID=A0A4Y7J7V9_PAPSO|nr:hypothetical protein C5167_014991 [Papaver somniferum]